MNTRVVVVRRENLNASLNFNIYNNQNLFTEFPANLITERNTELGNGAYPLKAEVGTPVGSFFGFRYLGVYPTTDDAVALNADGSRKMDANGKFPPPPLNGSAHAWHHPQSVLVDTIRNGTAKLGGNMPAWKDKLSNEQINDIIAWFQSKWSDEIYSAWYEMDQRSR